MSQNWPSFSFQVMPPLPTSTAAAHSSWVDDFLDFSTARRNANRRTVSDPITFVEALPFLEETHSSNATNNNNGFEKLDDEQLRSMFSDEVEAAGPASRSHSDPSTPSDRNSENEEKEIHRLQPKNEPGEEDISCFNPKKEAPPPPRKSCVVASGNGKNADPKRIKRSRVRKLQYISELERSVTTLQTEVSALSPKVAFLDHRRLLLNVDNSALKQRIAALAQDKIFKDAHQEALKKEIERLRKVYHEQNMKKMGHDSGPNVPPQSLQRAAGPPQ
ncbi:Basic-leucine zipper transcription factor family protein [Dorcoceras hygrometricum]|uniref:Basic-leucine zipper transcription factor family protein n=1 Tax=Dorcoceras hygrometricum TaxID=472368 RepID=A0A2Z7BU69_9LAMI|nr:Basic-leucine zipper transcription factor family protein [Dorcoceras hygrometricum]